MTTFVTILERYGENAWFFVVEDNIILWAQLYNAAWKHWSSSCFGGHIWSDVLDQHKFPSAEFKISIEQC